MLTMTASNTNVMSLSWNRVTDLLKFEVPYYICIPSFPSHISDSIQALCIVWLATNAHKLRCHNSIFKARHLAKLCGKLRNIPTRENKSVRCVNPHFVTRVLQVENTILCLIVLIWLKVLLPWDDWGNRVEWQKKTTKLPAKNTKGNFLNTHNLSIRSRVFFLKLIVAQRTRNSYAITKANSSYLQTHKPLLLDQLKYYYPSTSRSPKRFLF
jgi:hypothetical protein